MRTVTKWKRQWRQNYQFQTQEAESPKKPSNAMASSDLPKINDTTKCSKPVESAKLGVPWGSIKDSDPTAKNAAQKLKKTWTQTGIYAGSKCGSRHQHLDSTK
jgi:hypothetical protein